MNFKHPVHKILVVNLGGIGDVLLSQPALRALKNFYPQAYLVFLGVPRVCDLIRDFKIFDDIIPFSA